MGTSPVTGPTPNKGIEVAGVQKLGSVINQLTEVLKMVGATSEMGQAVMKALQGLAKLVPPGASNSASESNNIQNMALKNAQNKSMLQQMNPAAMGGAGGGQAPPPGMPQAA